MGFATDIIDLLSTGGFVASPVYGGDLPERPHKAVCITPTAGIGSTHTMGSTVGSPVLDSLRFQLRARALTYAEAETLMDTVHSALNGLRNQAINNKRYQWIDGASSPYYIGTDDEERPLFACNYNVERTNNT